MGDKLTVLKIKNESNNILLTINAYSDVIQWSPSLNLTYLTAFVKSIINIKILIFYRLLIGQIPGTEILKTNCAFSTLFSLGLIELHEYAIETMKYQPDMNGKGRSIPEILEVISKKLYNSQGFTKENSVDCKILSFKVTNFMSSDINFFNIKESLKKIIPEGTGTFAIYKNISAEGGHVIALIHSEGDIYMWDYQQQYFVAFDQIYNTIVLQSSDKVFIDDETKITYKGYSFYKNDNEINNLYLNIIISEEKEKKTNKLYYGPGITPPHVDKWIEFLKKIIYFSKKNNLTKKTLLEEKQKLCAEFYATEKNNTENNTGNIEFSTNKTTEEFAPSAYTNENTPNSKDPNELANQCLLENYFIKRTHYMNNNNKETIENQTLEEYLTLKKEDYTKLMDYKKKFGFTEEEVLKSEKERLQKGKLTFKDLIDLLDNPKNISTISTNFRPAKFVIETKNIYKRFGIPNSVNTQGKLATFLHSKKGVRPLNLAILYSRLPKDNKLPPAPMPPVASALPPAPTLTVIYTRESEKEQKFIYPVEINKVYKKKDTVSSIQKSIQSLFSDNIPLQIKYIRVNLPFQLQATSTHFRVIPPPAGGKRKLKRNYQKTKRQQNKRRQKQKQTKRRRSSS